MKSVHPVWNVNLHLFVNWFANLQLQSRIEFYSAIHRSLDTIYHDLDWQNNGWPANALIIFKLHNKICETARPTSLQTIKFGRDKVEKNGWDTCLATFRVVTTYIPQSVSQSSDFLLLPLFPFINAFYKRVTESKWKHEKEKKSSNRSQ